jgi:hypothetical protein
MNEALAVLGKFAINQRDLVSGHDAALPHEMDDIVGEIVGAVVAGVER